MRSAVGRNPAGLRNRSRFRRQAASHPVSPLRQPRRLRADHAIMLVEHDMDAVFRVADTITVMVNGSVIARGTPADVRSNPEVQSAYLGESE